MWTVIECHFFTTNKNNRVVIIISLLLKTYSKILNVKRDLNIVL